MAFNQPQIDKLSAPLGASHVRQRKQGGQQVSYIEGWHAIAEANRIFGFDAWSRETLAVNIVAQKERTIGKGQYEKEGWGVTYTARVRVVVGGVTREACGAGHGIDADLGQAHESAIKEAETDAMKRALMTFGNPFGLALYDKEQKAVCDDAPPAKQETPIPDRLIAMIGRADSMVGLGEAMSRPAVQDAISSLKPAERQRVENARLARMKELEVAA